MHTTSSHVSATPVSTLPVAMLSVSDAPREEAPKIAAVAPRRRHLLVRRRERANRRYAH